MTAAGIIAAAEGVAPGVARKPLLRRLRTWAPWGLGVFTFVLILIDLDIAPATVFRGLGRLGDFFVRMLPPSSGGDFWRIADALVETFAMAFAGTALAVLAAIPLGLIGAKTLISFGPAHFLIRRVYDIFRGVPALVWALVLISAFGLGPMGGVVALALADTPVLAKLYAEAIENADRKPMEAVRASGGGRLDAIRFGLAPQVVPVGASQALYYLESNFRNAAVLGIVGAGGIGSGWPRRASIARSRVWPTDRSR